MTKEEFIKEYIEWIPMGMREEFKEDLTTAIAEQGKSETKINHKKIEEYLKEIYAIIGRNFFHSSVMDKKCADVLQRFKEEAIAEHEQEQWKEYLKDKPTKLGTYNVSLGTNKTRADYWWGDKWGNYKNVVAFRELPKPYKPEKI